MHMITASLPDIHSFPLFLFDDHPDCYATFSATGMIKQVNRSWETILGYRCEKMVGRSVYELVREADRELFAQQLACARTTGAGQTWLMQLKNIAGALVWFSCFVRYHGECNRYFALCRNITEQVRDAERMVQREERLKILVENVNEYLYSVQYREGTFVDTFHNRQCEKVTGYTAQEFVDDPELWYTMIFHDDREAVTDNLEKIKETKKSFYIEHRITHKSGEVRWISNSCVSVVNDYEKRYQFIGFILDITDRKNKQTELYNHATFDSLTGIYNRRAGIAALERCVKRLAPSDAHGTICFFDINNLKEVNDCLGHFYGDDMLRTMTMLVQHELRSSDIFCRIGGDEFLLVFDKTKLDDAKHIIHRIINSIVSFNTSSKRPYRLYVSYGFSEYDPHSGSSTTELIEQADHDMYYYKERSRSNFATAISK